MSEPPFDVLRAQRWFAVEFNNRAWDLIEQPSRTAEQVQELIHAAHAAAVHWQAVGTPLQAQRAENLLATAYCVAGKPEPALRHAQRCLALSEQNASEESAFDRATAFGCAALAHQLAADELESERLMTLAQSAAEKLEADDRGVFENLYWRKG
jgi:hypothetical protein